MWKHRQAHILTDLGLLALGHPRLSQNRLARSKKSEETTSSGQVLEERIGLGKERPLPRAETVRNLTRFLTNTTTLWIRHLDICPVCGFVNIFARYEDADPDIEFDCNNTCSLSQIWFDASLFVCSIRTDTEFDMSTISKPENTKTQNDTRVKSYPFEDLKPIISLMKQACGF